MIIIIIDDNKNVMNTLATSPNLITGYTAVYLSHLRKDKSDGELSNMIVELSISWGDNGHNDYILFFLL
jgi:hypothetical protein